MTRSPCDQKILGLPPTPPLTRGGGMNDGGSPEIFSTFLSTQEGEHKVRRLKLTVIICLISIIFLVGQSFAHGTVSIQSDTVFIHYCAASMKIDGGLIAKDFRKEKTLQVDLRDSILQDVENLFRTTE